MPSKPTPVRAFINFCLDGDVHEAHPVTTKRLAHTCTDGEASLGELPFVAWPFTASLGGVTHGQT